MNIGLFVVVPFFQVNSPQCGAQTQDPQIKGCTFY